MDIDALRLLRLSHVAVGLAGLALFWIPVFARKGGRWHMRCGRLFAYCAYYAGGTGLLFSCWALVHPPSFFGCDLGEAAPTGATEDVRFLYSITGYLAVTVLAGTVLGVRSARARADHARLRSPLLLTMLVALGAWSLALLGYGLWNLASGAEGGARYGLSVALGAVGTYGAAGNLKYIREPPPTAMSWWYQHMECMLGAGIGFHAAAFFFGAKELLHLPLRGTWQLAPMLVPLLVGAPAMWVWIARYERRFEGAEESTSD